MLEADMSSSVRVPSSRLGTALSIATIEPLQSLCVLIHCPNTVVWAGIIAAAEPMSHAEATLLTIAACHRRY